MNNKTGRWARKRQRKKQAKMNKDSFRKTARIRLQNLYKAGKNRSRSRDKASGKQRDYIYSQSTFETYKRQFRYFAEWLDQKIDQKITITEAQCYVDEYLTDLINKGRSAYSIATAKAALVKVFNVDGTQFRGVPKRERRNIKRSRMAVERDKHISKKELQKLSRFTSATGLRRAEMLRITAEDLFFENGRPYLLVNKGTKGGKPRIAEIIGENKKETQLIINWIKSKNGRLFPRLSSHYDNHSYRAVYAKRIYNKYARKIYQIPPTDRYIMRKDRAGEIYDKAAMRVASRNLGHNRISVIAQSYLY